MVKASERRRFGRSTLQVTALGFGAATIGNLFRPIPEETAQAMLDTAWDAGVRVFDTAPSYGNGVSEDEADALSERIRADWPEQEVEVVAGGQEHYHYIVSVE